MKNFIYTAFIFIVLFCQSVKSQTDSAKLENDTLIKLLYSKNDLLRQLADSLGKAEIFKNSEKQVYSMQIALISNLGKVIYKVDDYLKKEIDTSEINLNLFEFEKKYQIASNGIVNDSNRFITERNLSTSALLLKGIQLKLDNWKKKLTKNTEDLEVFRSTIDSLQTDTLLFKFAQDSVLFVQYFNKLIEFSKTISPTDNNLTAVIKVMHGYLDRINEINLKISSANQMIKDKRVFESQNIFGKDSPYLWETEGEDNPVKESIEYSFSKGSLLLNYYINNNILRIIILFFGFIIILYLIYRTRKIFKEMDLRDFSNEAKRLIEFPFYTSVFKSLIFFQFLFSHPPVIFQGVIWIISATLLTIILWTYLSGKQRLYWLYLFIAFMVMLIFDLILKQSLLERWFLLAMSLSGITAGILAIKNRIFEVRNRLIKMFIILVSVLLLAASIISNISGRFNLTKTLLTISFFMLISGYLLYWGMLFSTELVSLFAATFGSGGNENFRMRLDRLKNRTPGILKLFFFIGWFVLIARNFYFYEYFMDGLVIFLEEERTVGDFTFTFEKIFIFLSILILSTLLSKIISFFADSSDIVKLRRENKAGLSNWMLLIRIGIMSVGVILAFAATGIPIDKMVIIIGSLGVGIGFGLQTLVNNLVSGLLLAFEKPFQIGDYIDIGDNSGRIKEIGIRSSKISTTDGADIIIPNGDLLSKHVTNWTMRNTMRRSEIVLSFTSSENIDETKKILHEILESNENIFKNMPSEVLLNNFTDSSAEYKLSFWTDIDKTGEVKSEIMLDVKNRLGKSEIDINPEKEIK